MVQLIGHHISFPISGLSCYHFYSAAHVTACELEKSFSINTTFAVTGHLKTYCS